LWESNRLAFVFLMSLLHHFARDSRKEAWMGTLTS
jgi:hypothetical protein